VKVRSPKHAAHAVKLLARQGLQFVVVRIQVELVSQDRDEPIPQHLPDKHQSTSQADIGIGAVDIAQ